MLLSFAGWLCADAIVNVVFEQFWWKRMRALPKR